MVGENKSVRFPVFKTMLNIVDNKPVYMAGYILRDFHREVRQELIDCGFLVEGERSFLVPDRLDCDRDDLVEAEWDPESRTYRYFSFFEEEWVTADEEDMQTWHPKPAVFLELLRNLIGVISSRPVREVVPELVWELGFIWVGKKRAPVYVARQVSHPDIFDLICDYLEELPASAPGILLTHTPPWSRRSIFPNGHKCMAIKDVVIEDPSGMVVIDQELLQRALTGQSTLLNTGPVIPSSDFGAIRIHEREFVVTGLKQKQILEILFQAWKSGKPKYRTTAIMEEIESSARALSQIFGSRDTEWKEFIGYGDGYCWLKV